jgi:hypothetical protein
MRAEGEDREEDGQPQPNPEKPRHPLRLHDADEKQDRAQREEVERRHRRVDARHCADRPEGIEEVRQRAERQ